MRKAKCQKCNSYEFVQEHHILPVSTFGENDQKTRLCPNCHNEYHQLLGRKNLKNPDPTFHFEKFFKWLYGLGILLLLIYLVW